MSFPSGLGPSFGIKESPLIFKHTGAVLYSRQLLDLEVVVLQPTIIYGFPRYAVVQ